MTLNCGELLLNGQYRIVRLLGRGGFGCVYEAQDTRLGEPVAIKELVPALVGDALVLKRFLAEAKATLHLTHERIVRSHHIFAERGNQYLVMEYMPGGTLGARLQQGGRLGVAEAVRMALQVCDGLSYAHERGVIHCDLKPANILFARDGGAKVADFGIAHVSQQAATRTWETSAGFAAGTLPYMSPEQTDGVRDDPRLDVYALGAVLYRALAGRAYLDFESGETPRVLADNVHRIHHAKPQPPSACAPHVPAWLDALVLKALAKRPEERYPSIHDLRAALAQGGSVPGHVRGSTGRDRSRPTRLPLLFWPLAAAAAVLLIVMGIALAALLHRPDQGQTRPTAPSQTAVLAVSLSPPAGRTPLLPADTPLPVASPVAPSPSPQVGMPVPTATPEPSLLEYIQEKEAGGYYVTSLAFGDDRWAAVVSNGVPLTGQMLLVEEEFPEQQIQEGWDAGYDITSLAYGQDQWVVVMSQGLSYTDQWYHRQAEFPQTFVREQWDADLYITAVSYGGGQWVVVMSESPVFTNQAYLVDGQFPKDYIREKWDAGYDITGLAHGGGDWAVVMTEGAGYTDQSYSTEEEYPKAYIDEKWDAGYDVTAVAHGSGQWAVVVSQKTDSVTQSWATRPRFR